MTAIAATPDVAPAAGGWLSLGPRENDASFALDLTRWIAAQAVVFGHASGWFHQFPALQHPNVPAMQDVAVVVFFLLSGFLIAHTIRRSLDRPGYDFREYAVDRIARIYAAYLPALLFIAIVDRVLMLRGVVYQYAYDGVTFLGNVLMLQDYPVRMISRITGLPDSVTSFGTGRPLWTLAIEMWIYLFVGAAVFFGRGGITHRQLGLLGLFSVVPLFNLFGGRGFGLFGCWLLGALVEWVCAAGYLRRIHGAFLAVMAAAGLGTWYLLLARNRLEVYISPSYAFLALAFLAAITAATRTRLTAESPRVRAAVSWLAGYSFTLYLTHYTVMAAFVLLFPGSGAQSFWTGFALSNVVAIAVAQVTERHHKKLRAVLHRVLDRLEQGFVRIPSVK